jgi:hypothetical protein
MPKTKSSAKKTSAKKTSAKKSSAKKSSAKKSSAKKSSAKKSSASNTKKPSSRTASAPSERALAAVDPERKRRYDDLVRQITEAKLLGARGYDQKYEAADEVLRSSLFLLTPHGTAAAWCEAVLEESYRSVARNARIARHFSPDAEARYSVQRLEAYLSLLEAQNGGPLTGPLKIDLDAVRIPVKRDGATRRLPLLEVQPAELAKLAREASGESAPARARRSPIEQAFAGALHNEDAFAEVTVRVHDNKLSIGGVPLSHLDVALKILRAVDWQAELPGAES